ncbi:proton-coupled zinc antiporter SLC30A2-like [Lycorma delicatula]|uniref:proton-coupled zinc antiporter SLC30A2-like n=1 Tax=Lycorma delicatula TaxID=130591 RepID=UPI003F51A487
MSLLDETDSQSAFCRPCQIPTSNSSTLLNINEMNDVVNGYKKAPIDQESSQSMIDSPYMQRRLTINSGDGADVPLLSSFDGFGPLTFEGNEHCHSPVQNTYNKLAWKQLIAATTVCLIFMVAEVVGGYLAGSLAIMTDAAHLLSDFVGLLVSLFAVWIARQTPTKRLTFGYYRVEVLSALLSVTVIWILTGVFIYIAVLRIRHLDFKINANTMIIVSVLGILVNIVMGLLLHGTCFRSHNHSHSRRDNNINVRAAIIHVMGDFIQSIGVFVSAVIIKFHPEAKIVDPICTFFFSLIVLATTMNVLSDSIWVLLEGFPSHINYLTLVQALSSLDGVESLHSLHVWCLTPGQYVLSVHLAVGNDVDREVILERAQRLLRLKFGIDRVTIQVESYKPEIILGCPQSIYSLLYPILISSKKTTAGDELFIEE